MSSRNAIQMFPHKHDWWLKFEQWRWCCLSKPNPSCCILPPWYGLTDLLPLFATHRLHVVTQVWSPTNFCAPPNVSGVNHQAAGLAAYTNVALSDPLKQLGLQV